MRVQSIFKQEKRSEVELKIAEFGNKKTFARKIGISDAYLYMTLNGRAISPKTALKISKGINMKMESLFQQVINK